MGKLTGDKKYYDDACKASPPVRAADVRAGQGRLDARWTSNTDDHPEFYWARANGWAAMAMAELLDVLPEDHPQRGTS